MEFEKLRDIIVEVLQIEPEKVTTETAFEDLDADSHQLRIPTQSRGRGSLEPFSLP